MKKSNEILFIISIAIVSMILLVPSISFATSTTNQEKTHDNDIKIQSKAKTVSYKITWNGNSGKIGMKKTITTTVNKGSKLNKLVPVPKRSGYIFKGWYTKKSGGNKITKDTRPKKSVIYYALWKKASTSTNTDSKLLGRWERNDWFGGNSLQYVSYQFNANRTFNFVLQFFYVITGNYKVSGGKITYTNIVRRDTNWIVTKNYSGDKIVHEYKIVKNSNGKEYLHIPWFYTDVGYGRINEDMVGMLKA